MRFGGFYNFSRQLDEQQTHLHLLLLSFVEVSAFIHVFTLIKSLLCVLHCISTGYK